MAILRGMERQTIKGDYFSYIIHYIWLLKIAGIVPVYLVCQ